MASASSAAPPRSRCVFGWVAGVGPLAYCPPPVCPPPVSPPPAPAVPGSPSLSALEGAESDGSPAGTAFQGPTWPGDPRAGDPVGGAVGAVGGGERPVAPRLGRALYALGQLMLIASLYVGYGLSRRLATGRESEALGNAVDVWRLERFLRLPDEAVLQSALLGHEWIPHGANWYYIGVHFPAAVLLLVWVFGLHRAHWPRVRNTMIAATGAALLIQLAYPLAPPRFLPDVLPSLRLVDTGTVLGPSPYGSATDGVANQYAAMPSLHVGWAILEAWAVVTILRHRARWLILIHPLATVAVVVVTANHYWLDGVVGGLLVLGAVVVVGRRREGSAGPTLLSAGFRRLAAVPVPAVPSPRGGQATGSGGRSADPGEPVGDVAGTAVDSAGTAGGPVGTAGGSGGSPGGGSGEVSAVPSRAGGAGSGVGGMPAP